MVVPVTVAKTVVAVVSILAAAIAAPIAVVLVKGPVAMVALVGLDKYSEFWKRLNR